MKTLSRATLMFVAMFLSGMALAGNPHFVGKVTAELLVNQNYSVEVCFKEAGLGKNQNIDYLATASADVTYRCVTNAGTCPAAENKQSTTTDVATPGTFSSGKNGSISQCLILSPPAATLSCPAGQTAVLSSIEYNNIQIRDTTTGISKDATPSPLGADPFMCP